jgi:photosystem II stability/assembly factor-like uncharacterized protein
MSTKLTVGAGLLLACLVSAIGVAGPVAESLQRPALQVREPSHAVLLAVARAGDRLVAVGERGIVALSDDHAASWRQAKVPASVTLTRVRFWDEKNGIAVGHGGAILTTPDGGETWTLRLDGRRIAELALAAAKTTGDTAAVKDAERLVADGPDKPLLDILLIDARRALVVGAYGLAFATEDGGHTWTPWMDRFDNPKSLHLYAVRSRGNQIVIAGEQGLLLMSDDTGKTFKRLASPYKGSFFTAELPSDNEIVVAGLRGNVWRSMDRGSSWAQVTAPANASITASAVRTDGSVLLVNQGGSVFSTRGGQLEPLNQVPLPSLNAVLTLSEGGLLVATMRGVISVSAAGVRPAVGSTK